MDTTSSQSSELTSLPSPRGIMWLYREELAAALDAIGAKNNHGLLMETHLNATQKAAFVPASAVDVGYAPGNPNINHD